MITHALAKQLKNAGFPQNNKHYCPQEECFEDACRPALSELIEECGEREIKYNAEFFLKFVHDNRWDAGFSYDGSSESFTPYEVHGSSKKEAVANLWLVINKKI